MNRHPPRSKRTDTHCPYTTRFRSVLAVTGDGQPALLAHDRGTRIEVLVVGALGMRPARWPPEDLRPGPEPVAASRALAAKGRSNRHDLEPPGTASGAVPCSSTAVPVTRPPTPRYSETQPFPGPPGTAGKRPV